MREVVVRLRTSIPGVRYRVRCESFESIHAHNAYAEVSGAPLAVAPDHWTDGCPVIVEHPWTDGPPVEYRSYLDPGSGRVLHVEAVLAGAPRSFSVQPARWATSGVS